MAVEWTSVVAAASVGGAVAFFGRLAYDGVKRKNGNSGGLKAHDDSATAHPDIREDMSTMSKKITTIDDRTSGMDKKLDRLLGDGD